MFSKSVRSLAVITLLAVLALAPALRAADDADVAKYKEAMQKGIAYLKAQQNPDGSWGKDFQTGEAKGNIGISALVLYAIVSGPFAEEQKKGDLVAKAVEFLLKSQDAAGGFSARGEGNENYYTSNAVLALAALDKEKYKEPIAKAVKFLKGIQCVEEQGYDKDRHPLAYGGQGYGSSMKPDLSNTQFFLEALVAAGHPKDSKEFKAALTFLHRCQASAEVNDMEWAKTFDPTRTDKGGSIYAPNRSEAGEVTDKRTGNKSWRAYGSMTYAMVKSYIYCDVKPDSPELKAAFQFIANNYSVESNPGMDQQGIYYYYVMMSKALNAYGQAKQSRLVEDADKTQHDWSKEMGDKLLSLQKAEGFWMNEKSRWWEADPKLVTAYSLIAYNQILEIRAAIPEKK